MGTASAPHHLSRNRQRSEPAETDTCFYRIGQGSLSEILAAARQKWPNIIVGEISITPVHLQTANHGFDQYDPFDYTDFIKIEAHDAYFARLKSKK